MNYRYVPFYVKGNAITGMYYGQQGYDRDKDLEYIREMYPETFAGLQECVEQECDRLEFAGSMMFDEYPDKMEILRTVNRIFSRAQYDNAGNKKIDTDYPGEQWMKDIIRVLLLNEMYRRRVKRKKYYGGINFRTC